MSDEGGAGPWVAAMMKQLDNPSRDEVALLERVVTETVSGKLQVTEGKHAGGVKKSLFWYDAKRFPNYYDANSDWSTWTSWPQAQADNLERLFNYPHVAAGHWVLYRLARHHAGFVTRHDWRWYLDRATLTALAMTREGLTTRSSGRWRARSSSKSCATCGARGWRMRRTNSKAR